MPDLKDKAYSDYSVAQPEWELLDLIREVLEVRSSHIFSRVWPVLILSEASP